MGSSGIGISGNDMQMNFPRLSDAWSGVGEEGCRQGDAFAQNYLLLLFDPSGNAGEKDLK
jgi:hypothetical protein